MSKLKAVTLEKTSQELIEAAYKLFETKEYSKAEYAYAEALREADRELEKDYNSASNKEKSNLFDDQYERVVMPLELRDNQQKVLVTFPKEKLKKVEEVDLKEKYKKTVNKEGPSW